MSASKNTRKENALDLAKFVDKGVRVKLSGGREGARKGLILILCLCVLEFWTCASKKKQMCS